jgi:hypothetical protein
LNQGATPEQPQQPHANSTPKETSDNDGARRRWIWVVGLLVFALGLGLAGGAMGGLIVQKDDDSSSDAQPDKDQPYTGSISEEDLLALIVNASPDGGATLSDPSSPQSRAFEWLLVDLNSPHSYPSSDRSKLQRYALSTLYYAFNGWDNVEMQRECEYCDPVKDEWLSIHHECDWSRVYCDADNAVMTLNLRGLSASGTIPSELSLLKESLKTFDLADNYVSGSISSKLSLLTKLQTLRLNINRITGPVPANLGQLSLLVDLCLGQNALTGSIPTELSLLTDIDALSLKGNLLNGRIPSELGRLSYMTQLDLVGNSFFGAIVPSELCNLPKLAGGLDTECRETEKIVCCCCEMCCRMQHDVYSCSSFNPCDPDDYDSDDDISEMPEACSVCLL